MGLSTSVKATVAFELTGAADLGEALAKFGGHSPLELQSGTTAGLADVVFSDRRTLAASATEDLDLAGALVNPIGGAAVFAKVKAILVRAAAANTNNVVVGGAGSNTFVGPFGDAADTVSVPPGGALLLAAPSAGWNVTAGTGDLLKLANSSSGTPVTYEIVIIGTSA